MVIKIKDLVGRCYSNEDGKIIFDVLNSALNNEKMIILSFKDVDSITSSFTNTAFIELLHEFDYDFIKKNLRIVDSNKYINGMIKDRFTFEVNRINQNKLVLV
ncbi:STAS-like domain-containing protein [Peribacillus simplex]|uniref:STAS-like domain-containing protein n=1 Tax=Peribacillus simplex TaxID=1478 RepID=UPI002E1AA1BD|nr:STAS-like domain-containing protein [Peribacillus simplex]MED4096835.1 STAS-like domain-containing protein [Peribacillus simplex]